MIGRQKARKMRTAVLLAGCVVAMSIPAPRLSAAGVAEPPKVPEAYSALRLCYGLAAPSDQEKVAPGLYMEIARTWAVPFVPFLGLDLEAAFNFLPGPSGSIGDLFADASVGLGQAGLGLSSRFRMSRRLRLYARGSVGMAAIFNDYRLPFDAVYCYSGAAGLGYSFWDAFALGIEARYAYVDGFSHLLCLAVRSEINLPTAPPPRSRQPALTAQHENVSLPSEPLPRGAARPVPQADNQLLAVVMSPAVLALNQKVKESPYGHVEQLVAELTAGSKSGFEKARAIHDWIALNISYDTAAYSGSYLKIVEPELVIQRGASVCQGYSNVFQLMCNKAGLDCTVISGYGRGVGFDPFRESDTPYDSNHAWNAVRIDGLWYLVDCTWDAGSVDSGTTFTRQYSNQYLFADPEGFLHTHFPGAGMWQLLDRPVSYQEFCQKPYLRGAFFQHGLSIDTDTPRVMRVDDTAAVHFEVPAEVALRGYLERADGSTVDNAVQVERIGREAILHVRFPAPGRYRLDLFVGRQGAGAGARVFFDSAAYVGCLILEASRGSTVMFPRGY